MTKDDYDYDYEHEHEGRRTIWREHVVELVKERT